MDIMYLVALLTGSKDETSIGRGCQLVGIFSDRDKAAEYANNCNEHIQDWAKPFFAYVPIALPLDPEFNKDIVWKSLTIK